MKNVVILLAGGIGSRIKAGVPKQFLKIAGMSVLEHTIAAFQRHPLIDEIAIVANDAYQQKISAYIINNNFTKVKKILSSGVERHHSSLSAIKAYVEVGEECHLIFHDAVRPLISSFIINHVIDALNYYEAVDVGIPSADTIIQIDDDNTIINIPPRKALRRGQTPQGFLLSTIKEAYDKAMQDPNFITTDDCGVVLKYLPTKKIGVVMGEEANMKLTYPEDLYLIEKLFQLKVANFDQKVLLETEGKKLHDKVVVIFGASSGIGADLLNVCRMHGSRVHGFSRSMNHVDITNINDVRNALRGIYTLEGRVDYVVDTASVLYKEPLTHMDYKQIDDSININYRGMVTVAKESFPFLKESQGVLLFYTSSSYTRGRMNYTIYSSTKCATVNFVQALAEEWYPFNIRVNCINPERTKTPMRIKNFGVEDDATLLNSIDVAIVSAKVLTSPLTGQVVDVKLKAH